MVTVVISPEEARHVLYHFGHPAGVKPGSFTEALVSAAAKADAENFARLAIAFPSLMGAVQAATQVLGGTDMLAEIASRG